MNAESPAPQAHVSRVEFVALVSMLFATIAFSIDAMLPALPEMAAELSPDAPNRAQLVLTSFLLGMGIGTFFTGPLSDTFGRKPVMLTGAALYALAAFAATLATDLEHLLAARVLQGLAAAAPRVVALAVIRDLYAGRGMARIMSFVMLVFTLFPALAPSIGAVLIAWGSWRSVFVAFIVFAALTSLWLFWRLPETLPPEKRRPFHARVLWAALKELLAHRVVRYAIMVLSLSFGMLFAMLSSVQPIYDVTFGRADSFPYWFGLVAIMAGSASFVNAALVMRLGMRRLVTLTLGAQCVIVTVYLSSYLAGVNGDWAFGLFVAWQTSVFFQAGMTIGNLNAMALEPVGHMAGLASSVLGAVATVVSVALAAPVGLAFDGTPVPVAIGTFLMAMGGFLLMLRLKRREAGMPA